ncbi:AMP-binding protein [Kutzneria chonburiensis]|uniref:AMP-binding protein n=1 Tax=Kutzneria chonburiensis TaxID=1483604 RepID=A0ABV6N0D6_9PSEU
MQNYVAAVLAGIGTDPERVVVHQPDGGTITAAGLTDLIHRYAHALRERGVGRGSTVSIMSDNRAEVQAARYATNLLGARVVSLYEGMAVDTLAVIAADVETDVLVTDTAHAADGARIAEQATIKHVLSFSEMTGPSTPIEPVPVHADDIYCVRHTGGTTGHPKGILLPFGPHTAQLTDPRRPRQPDVMLVCSTLAHLAGMMVDGVLLAGGSVVIQTRFDPASVLDAIERHRVQVTWLLPALLYQLTEQQRRSPVDISSLRVILYGGASSSPSRMAEAVEVFGPIFLQMYAQTEAGGISVLMPAEHARPELLGTAGRPFPGVEIRIVDDAGDDAPTGEIIKRADGQSRGYLNNPELTAQVWRDGWVHTGDVGFFDASGYLHVTDRLKDMIIVVGGHVYPTEVEEALLRHPAIAATAVFGVRDSDGIEQVHAALVLRSELDLDAVRAHVTEQMGRQYAPAAITVLDAIPLTPAGKPDKKLLRAAARE